MNDERTPNDMSKDKLPTPKEILRDIKEISNRDKINKGVCVSPHTTDRCPYCVDVCEAALNRIKSK